MEHLQGSFHVWRIAICERWCRWGWGFGGGGRRSAKGVGGVQQTCHIIISHGHLASRLDRVLLSCLLSSLTPTAAAFAVAPAGECSQAV